MPEVELASACDLDLDRARAAAPQAYTSPQELFEREKPDFVDIATRPESHLALVELACAHKIATICQKPMAPTWAEAAAMAKTAEQNGVPLMIHENWRWQPWYRQVKEFIGSGEIGAPLNYLFRTCKRDGLGVNPYPEQPYFRRMPRLLIYETIVHHIDTARFLFGEISSIYAQAQRINAAIAGEDQAFLLLTHKSGLVGCIQGHRFLDTNPAGPVLGDAFFDGDRARLTVLPTGDVLLGSSVRWSNNIETGYRGDSVLATQQHFTDCLRSGRTFESAAREYLRTVSAVEAAYKSIAEHQPIAIANAG